MINLEDFFSQSPFNYDIDKKNELLIDSLKLNLIHQYQNCIPFKRLLDKKEFSKMIYDGIVKKEKNNFIVDCYLKEKGNIILYFNVKNYDLMGWDLISLNNSKIQFRMFNNSKNLKIDEKIFNILKIN